MQEYQYKLMENDTYMVNGYEGDEAHVSVPATYYGKDVTLVYDRLFSHHEEIEQVTLPSSITCLGSLVFDGCRHLHEITLPEHLTDIMQYAFTRSGIKEITIPDDVTLIFPYTFHQCFLLKRVKLGKNVRHVYGMAFHGCPMLEEVWIPSDAKVHEDAFQGCLNVKVHRF